MADYETLHVCPVPYCQQCVNFGGDPVTQLNLIVCLIDMPDSTRDTLASRCSKGAARKLQRCGTGDRAKNTYCELSSFVSD